MPIGPNLLCALLSVSNSTAVLHRYLSISPEPRKFSYSATQLPCSSLAEAEGPVADRTVMKIGLYDGRGGRLAMNKYMLLYLHEGYICKYICN